MKSLNSLLKRRKVQKNLPLSDKDVFYFFQKVAKEEFGNIGAANLEADYFKNKTLFVKAKSSAWGSELFINREEIKRKINEKFSHFAIKEIKIK